MQIEADVGRSECFIMPKALNDNVETLHCFGQYLADQMAHFQVNYTLNTHARWISNLLLHADLGLTSSFSKVLFCRQHDHHKHSTRRSFLEFAYLVPGNTQCTVTQKMADQGRSDLDVVFTMILCAANFFYLVSYEAHIHKLASNSF